jgi:hypothetical protein
MNAYYPTLDRAGMVAVRQIAFFALLPSAHVSGAVGKPSGEKSTITYPALALCHLNIKTLGSEEVDEVTSPGQKPNQTDSQLRPLL